MSSATAPAPMRANLPVRSDRSDSALPQIIPGTGHNQQLIEKYHREVGNVVNSRAMPLGPGELLVKTLYGFYLVVPTWNLDVATGIVRDGVIEPWTNEVALSLLSEGNGFVNVGANFGYYSVLAAQKVGRSGKVYAVEANPVVFKYIAKTLYWSGYPDVIEAYNCAAASPDMHGKPIGFYFDPQFIGGGNMFSDGKVYSDNANDCLWNDQNITMTLDENRKFCIGGIFSHIETVGKTVDSIVPITQKIHAMLIDAEGSECFVIGGSKEMIRRNPNMSIILEWAPHNYECDPARRPSMDAMWDFLLGEMKYQVLRICPENYPGFGAMPKLERLTREQLMKVPHSDLLVRRG